MPTSNEEGSLTSSLIFCETYISYIIWEEKRQKQFGSNFEQLIGRLQYRYKGSKHTNNNLQQTNDITSITYIFIYRLYFLYRAIISSISATVAGMTVKFSAPSLVTTTLSSNRHPPLPLNRCNTA